MSAGGPADADALARRSAAVTIVGRGNGHGHGMSQYGAEGAAQKGLNARQILSFYYPGLKHGTEGGNISVLITEDTTSDVVVSARSGLRAVSGDRSLKLDKSGVKQWRLTPAGHGRRTAVAYKAGGWHQYRVLPGYAQFTAGGAPITLHVPVEGDHGPIAYRGVLRSAPANASGTKRLTVNVLPLESYLRGVVPSEIFPSWHPATLQAQAVAARTYAAFERAQPLSKQYQICDSPACQAYTGTSQEFSTTDDAVKKTAHQVLTYRGDPAFTQFSASNGGWMVAGSEPYLVSKRDPYDKAWRDWKVTIRPGALEAAYPSIGRFQSVKVTKRDGHGSWGGRVEVISVRGTRSTVTLSGDEFRSAFGMMSTWFKLT